MKKNVVILMGLVLVAFSCQRTSKQPKASALELFTDALVQEQIDSATIAGTSILVHQRGKTLLKKSYGYASLELSAPMPENGIFEIGSVTKQFTAAAILKLVENKQLSLDDELTKYLDFDTKGRKVTINQLLNHTSGIASYTAIDEFFDELSLKVLPRDSLLRLVETKEFMFEPGEALIYNNSAFFFLGLIIEKVTGETYEAFIERTFFEPLGMHNTSYCSVSTVRKDKVYGYGYTPSGLQQKGYQNHNWPYAAGSLCSTTEDLLIWMTALHQGKVFSEATYQSLITPGQLNDGANILYAKALVNYSDFGHQRIGHGGGIQGFLTDTRYYPDEELYIICLVNTTGPQGANDFADAITWELLDKELPQPTELDVDTKGLEGSYTGAIRGAYSHTIEVKSIDRGLTIRSEGEEQVDTLNTYIGNYTWADGNTRIHIKNNEYRYVNPYSYFILKKKAN